LEAAWCVRLRQPARDFWRSTPARVTAFFRVARLVGERDDYRFGLLAAIIANRGRQKHQRALQPFDFFPSLRPPKPRIMTGDEVKSVLLSMFPQAGTQPRSR
jgi:hypothetical protein